MAIGRILNNTNEIDYLREKDNAYFRNFETLSIIFLISS